MCDHDWRPHRCSRFEGDHFICKRCGDEMARSLPIDYQKRLAEEGARARRDDADG